jgi:hypothetical protein
MRKAELRSIMRLTGVGLATGILLLALVRAIRLVFQTMPGDFALMMTRFFLFGPGIIMIGIAFLVIELGFHANWRRQR